LVALAIACLATFLVALVAWPLYGGRSATDDAAELERDGRRLKQGLVLTFVALAVLAMGTASGWWPQDEGNGDIAVQATSGERRCGSLTDAGPGAEVSNLRTIALQLYPDRFWYPIDVGVPAASCSAPMNHDVDGLAERRARRTCARSDCIRRKGSHSAQGRWRAPSGARSRRSSAASVSLTSSEAGEQPRDELAAARFALRGLAGVIAWPRSEPVYLGALVGAQRPPWSGAEDPRETALGEVYGFLVAHASATSELARVVGR
jgi:hypothetical protein